MRLTFVFLSDCHLMIDRPKGRLDNFAVTAKNKFEFVLKWAYNHSCIIIQAGDFFDVSRNWNVLSSYAELLKNFKVDLLTVFGQHDLYFYSEKLKNATSIGVLNILLDQLNILDSKPYYKDNVAIYGCSYGEEIPKPRTDGTYKKLKNILVIHKMIVPNKIWSTQEDYVYAPDFLKQHKEYDIILTGDCHRKFLFEDKGRYIVNTGCLLRHEANEYNLTYKPGFYYFDGVDFEWIEVPHESAKEVISRDHLEEKKKREEALQGFVENIRSEEMDSSISFIDNLISFVKSNKISKEVKETLAEIIDEEIRWEKRV